MYSSVCRWPGFEKIFAVSIELDQAPKIKEGGVIGAAAGLLHVVRDDDDGVLLLQLPDQLFHFGGGDGIERGAGLIHQDDLGLDREGARNAETLLLARRKARSR